MEPFPQLASMLVLLHSRRLFFHHKTNYLAVQVRCKQDSLLWLF